MPEIRLGAKSGSNSRPADYAKVLEAGDDFVTSGSLCGSAGEVATLGRLDGTWKDSVRHADYVVYSYDTPIAWRVPGEGWTVPARGTLGSGAESKTTVRHMNKIREALSLFTEWEEK